MTDKHEAFTVQWSLPPTPNRNWRSNEEALVLAPTGQAAIAEILRRHPDANIHQLQRRGTRVLIVEREAT